MRSGDVVSLVNRGLVTPVGEFVLKRVDVFGEPSAPLEVPTFLESFLPSLMPRTTQLQGLAAGLSLITARVASGALEIAHAAVLRPGAGIGGRLGLRVVEIAVGQAAASIPESDDETLWVSGLRTGGEVVRAAAIGGLIYDAGSHLRGRRRRGSPASVFVSGVMVIAGAGIWASYRLAGRRREVRRWPVVQEATTRGAMRVGIVAAGLGRTLSATYGLTGRGFRAYFGHGPTKRLLAGAANAGAWAATATVLYNVGVGRIGNANEKVEPGYTEPPESPLVSGSAQSLSPFDELGLQGRRFVLEPVSTQRIEEVIGEPAVAEPIRTYVGFNTEPLYATGRAEIAVEELARTGAFDRSYLLLVSPTGTGWVDQTVVEAAEFLTGGDIATCCIQYGRFPSFLCVQKVGVGRMQFRTLLWGIRQRLAERPPDERPKVLVFGESLGAWTSSDVVMSQGMVGFDHYGIDRALWFGLPALAKWSRNGMAAGSSDLAPAGTVAVFDRHEQLASLTDDERDRLRAVILSHDSDPIAALRPELMVRRPEWLKGERGRDVPEGMDWIPLVTFWQVAVDAANAMKTVPGDFQSFGHDYRADTAHFVRDAFRLPVTDEEATLRVDQALRALEIARKNRIQTEADDERSPHITSRYSSRRFQGGVPMKTASTAGPKWVKSRRSAEHASAHKETA